MIRVLIQLCNKCTYSSNKYENISKTMYIQSNLTFNAIFFLNNSSSHDDAMKYKIINDIYITFHI
jgi:hypothetical protein